MPQKSRREKERTALRRETGQIKAPIIPAPVELTRPDTNIGVTASMPGAPVRRVSRTATIAPMSHEDIANYSYVYSDLRRIALLALLCVAIMVALTFVLH